MGRDQNRLLLYAQEEQANHVSRCLYPSNQAPWFSYCKIKNYKRKKRNIYN